MLLHIVAPFAFAYLLSYLFRVVNAVAGPAIAGDIGVDTASLGFLTSVYFLTFAGAQLPLGVALDRYGPRRVESLLLLVAAAGAAIFALSNTTWGLAIGRGLIGLGVAACLMGAFKAYAMNVPLARLPLINAVHMSAGGLGLFLGGAPAEWAIAGFGWRGLFGGLAALSVLSAFLLFTMVREQKATALPPSTETLGEQVRSVGRILTEGAFLRVAALTVPNQAAFHALLGLWAGPWLRDIAGYSAGDAALVLSATAFALVAGFLFFGALSTRLGRSGFDPMRTALWAMATFIVAQALLVVVPPAWGAVTWCLFAFLGTTGLLPFPALTALYPRTFAGRVNTAMNFLVFVAAFAVQWLIGVWLEASEASLGLKAAYDSTLVALIACQVVGAIVLARGLPQRAAAA